MTVRLERDASRQDWNGDGIDDLAVFLLGVWTLDDGDPIPNATDANFTYGQGGDVPVAGKWQNE